MVKFLLFITQKIIKLRFHNMIKQNPKKYNYQMSLSLQQIKQATKRKSNGYFFLKSKHSHPTYKNHSYFEMKQKYHTQQSQQNYQFPHNHQQQDKQYIINNKQKNKRLKKWKMFVQQPSSFGIENTYKYMCNMIKFGVNKNIMRKSIEINGQKQQNIDKSKDKIVTQDLIRSRKRVHTDITTDKIYNHKISPKQNIKKKDSIKPVNKYLKTTQSFSYRIKKYKKIQQQLKSLKLPQPAAQNPAQHKLQLYYIFSRAHPTSQLNNIITLNLLPFIIQCFLKCKINYTKKLTQNQYNTIITSILSIQNTTKSYFDIKDIVNLSSIQQILQILQIYGQNTIQWIQTLRYFFIPNQEVLKYQYMKIIDEIKIISILKFNVQFKHQDGLYIYRVQDRVRITNIYDLLKPGTYIYSQSKAAYEIYCSILKNKAQIFSYKNRINRWRSIAPLDQTIPSFITDRNSSTLLQQNQNTQQKYNRLFQIRQMNRKKYHSAYKKSIVGSKKQGKDGSFNGRSNGNSFIDKSKLHHYEDIFQ